MSLEIKTNQQLKEKKWDRCFVFPYHKSRREVTQYRWRVSCLLLTQRRNTFAIQRQIKQGMYHATWIARLSYLPRPGNIQLPPKASKHREFFGCVWTECLCQKFSVGTNIAKQSRWDLSQEKLTQIPLGQRKLPQLHCWDCQVIGLKELESGIVT